MATRTISLRLPEDLLENLSKSGDSINQTVIKEFNALKRIRLVSMGELKGIFSPNEWIFLADVFNSVRVEDVFRTNVGVMIATCEDAEKFEGAASKHNVNLSDFIEKVKKLHGANIESIITRIEDYWNCKDGIDTQEWANF